MISVAHAASNAGATEASFYHDPTFWVALAFIVLIVLVAKPVSRMVGTALDDRAETIKGQLDEAEKLREEAQELLASFKRKQQEAEEEASKILQRAKDEAARLEAKSKTDLENMVKRREVAAQARISQAEAAAVAEVQAYATQVALKAAEELLKENTSAQVANAMIDSAIADLPKQLGN